MRQATAIATWLMISNAAMLLFAAEPDSVNRDYSSELPRIAPLSPEAAMASFRTPAGYRVERVAAEPAVVDPIAMSFDAAGRLFVIEMRGYSERQAAMAGQVRMLEDRDNDGVFEHSEVFAAGFSWPTAIFCCRGGVLVAAAPDLWFMKDTTGDGKADVRQKLYTGFGRSNVQGLVNSFRWGMDNLVHGATSSSGATLRKVQPDGSLAKESLTLRGRDFAIDIRDWSIQPVSGGGQHGVSFDDDGCKFVCSNSDHLQMVMFEDRYVARNPYFPAPSPRISIAEDGPQADVFRSSPVEPWRIVRTRLRKAGIVPGPVERGGKAAGYFTGATGVTIYRGDAWPAEHRGLAIVGDVGSNLVHRKRLSRAGLEYRGQRIDKKSELLTSTDPWFRPAQFANAPDGALYIADMYREVIEHPKSLHPAIKKHLDLNSGNNRGRIYRLVHTNTKSAGKARPKLHNATTPQLVAALDHPNGWTRDTAARLLYEQRDPQAAALLTKQLEHATPLGKIHTLHALAGLGALQPQHLTGLLEDKNPQLQKHAVRLSEGLLASSPLLVQTLIETAEDAPPLVLYQLAFSLGEAPVSPARNAALAAIARRAIGLDASSRKWMLIAVQTSLAQGSGDLFTILAADKPFREHQAGRTFLLQLARQIGRQQKPADIAALLPAAADLARTDASLLRQVVTAVNAKPGSKLATDLATVTGAKGKQELQRLLASATTTATDESANIAQRVTAIRQLRWGAAGKQVPVLAQLLTPSQPAQVQSAALETLAGFHTQLSDEFLLTRINSFSPPLQKRTVELLLSRKDSTLRTLQAIAAGKLPPGVISLRQYQQLALSQNPEIKQLAQKHVTSTTQTQRNALIQQYQPALEMAGDAKRGHAVFTKHCATCHRVGQEGTAIGPSLAAMTARGGAALLTAVLDPNREVNPQFSTYLLTTNEGRIYSGMLAAETANSITLQPPGKPAETILRIDIEELTATGRSLMPEDFEKHLKMQDVADLFQFLQNSAQ